MVMEPGALKDRIDEAIQSIKYNLVAAVSIGFRAIRDKIEFLEDGGIRFLTSFRGNQSFPPRSGTSGRRRGLPPAVLPHHRAYGSVHGGS
jgi:hypothetical protein